MGAKKIEGYRHNPAIWKAIISCHFDSRFNVIGILKPFYCTPSLMQLVYSLKSYQAAARLQMLRVE